MTDPEDGQSNSRPISVAELLAKNGTIGAPPVGGRRRRRRGNADAVTVAELTGEIPIITDDSAPPSPRRQRDTNLDDTTIVAAVDAEPRRNGAPTIVDDQAEPARAKIGQRDSGAVEDAEYDLPPDSTAEPEAEHPAAADPEPDDLRRPRRNQFTGGVRDFTANGTGAEQMSPDPLDELDGLHDDRDGADNSARAGLDTDVDVDVDARDVHSAADTHESYLDSPLGSLFGGPSVDDDLDSDFDRDRDRDRVVSDDADIDHDEFEDELDDLDADEGSPLVRGLWVVAQCIIAVAFGAGLFVAFDQLWKWNTIVALVLGVLVILGLAGGVRVVRKTEDIGSTLTAVAVGALVTFGPLALLQAS
jgi:hypothetical protein